METSNSCDMRGGPAHRREEGNEDAYTETYNALYEFVHALECPLCSELMTKPSTFKTCGHTFCFECVIKTLEGKGIRWPGCPTCGQAGCRKDLKTNHLVGNAIGQVRRMMGELARANVQAAKERNRSEQRAGRDGVEKIQDAKRKKLETKQTQRETQREDEVEQDEIENSTEEGRSLELMIDCGTDDQRRVTISVQPTEMQQESLLASLRSPANPFGSCASPGPTPSLPGASLFTFQEVGEVTKNDLMEDVRCLRAVLEVMDELPVTQGSEGDGGEGESPSTQHHLVVRRDSEGEREREASVVPDSQDEHEEEVGEVAASARVLTVREPNVERSGEAKAQKVEKVEKAEETDARSPGTAQRPSNDPQQEHRHHQQQPSVKPRSLWQKAKQRGSNGSSSSRETRSIRVVVDARTIVDDPTVMSLLERFEAKHGTVVTVEDAISEQTTHFVVGMDALGMTKLTVEYLEACAVGCWVVSPSWLEDSLQNGGEIVGEKYHAAHGHVRDDGTTQAGLPENSRIRAIAGKRVFLGQSFVLAPGAKRSDQLMRLIEFAGGTFQGGEDEDEAGVGTGTGMPLSEGDPSQSTQKKVTCVVDSKRLSSLSVSEKKRLCMLQENAAVAVVNERWLYASVERGQAQLRNDGFYVL